MAVTVKKITLWRGEVSNKPGVLAATLELLANSGADLQVVMGYGLPGKDSKALIEVYPVSGKQATSAGLSDSGIPTLLVTGDNHPGLSHAIAKALGDAGINIDFLVAQVIGATYSAVFGFKTEEAANKAAALIERVSSEW